MIKVNKYTIQKCDSSYTVGASAHNIKLVLGRERSLWYVSTTEDPRGVRTPNCPRRPPATAASFAGPLARPPCSGHLAPR